jgi:tetratricopeptide (TPR) repeat protein/predicted Ser/Thr protein kinase
MSSERDLVVARVCLEKGYATPEQIQECLKVASSSTETARPVEAVLRRHGYISEEAYRELAALDRRSRDPQGPETLRRCATCGTVYSNEICPKCIAGFALAGESKAPDGDPAARSERASAALDPEIEKAAADPANRFGKYVLLRELGAGGMGVVFKAWQSDLRRIVALKFIRGVEAQQDLERFIREAQLSATLSHPGIAPIYESGVHEGKHFFAMQYVEGLTLDRFLAATPRPPLRKAVEILAHVAEAVDYAHEHGIIHRDLKPANVMIDARGRAYVMDFGLAKSVRTGSSLTGSGFAVGTPSYMSPEQAQGEAQAIGPRSDVYALGAILYEIGAGRPPFAADNVVQILVDVVHRDPEPPRKRNPKLHPELETVALKALEKDPNRRYAGAADFAADLRRWLDGEPVLARPAGTVSRLVRKIRKHKLAAAGAAALLLGLSFVLGTWAFRAREQRTRSDAKPYYEEAATLYDAANKLRFISKAPDDALVQYRSQLRRAEENAEHAVGRDPGYVEAHFLLGRIHSLLLNRSGAEADFTRAITLDPGHLRAFVERALLRLQIFEGKYGLQSFSLRKDTKLPQLYWNRADARADGERAGILRDLEAASRLADRDYEKELLQGASQLILWRSGPEDGLLRAEEHLMRARALLANDPVPLQLLSTCRLLRADFAGAANFSATAIELAPNDHVILYHASALLLYADRLDEALAAVDRALRIDPNDPGLLNVRANILGRQKNYPAARAAFEAALAEDPRNSSILGNLGYLLYQISHFEDAAAVYGRAVEAAPDEADGYEGRAVSNLALGKLEEAEKDMDRVVGLRPTADSYSNRGAMRSQRKRFVEAMEDYQQALQLEPRNAAVAYNIGILRAREGKHADAVEAYQRAIELGRVQADGYIALAKALNKLRRFKEAEAASTRALELAPGNGTAHADRAQARTEQGRLAEGLDDYLKALEKLPNDSGILRDLGLINMKARRQAQALPYLQRSRELGNVDAGPLLGECLLQLERLDDAEAAFTQAAKDLPKDPLVLFGRARVRQQLERRKDAIADLDAAVAIAPNFAEAIGLRGVLKLEEKRRAEAAADLRRAMELKPALKPAFGPYLAEAIREE